MTKGSAIHSFFSGFGITAYASTSVPEDAEFPYLTYTPFFDTFGNQVSLTINLWYRTESEAIPSAKAQELSNALSGGKYLICDGGAILLQRGSPWCQSLSDDSDPLIKRRYINITAEFLTLN